MPFAPVPTSRASSTMRSSEEPNAAQCSRSSALADLLAGERRRLAPGAVADRLVPRLQVVQGGCEQQRERRAEQQVVEVALGVVLEPLPLVGVEHRALLGRVEHPPGARVDHHQPRTAEVAAVAPARPRHLAVGLERERAQDRPAVLGRPKPRVEVVVGQVGRRQVAHVLVEPVRGEPADDALVPPAGRAHRVDPRLRRVPVVVDVVVVEDHRRRDRREQPADVGLRPRRAVEPRVLLEVRDGLVRRDRDVARGADVLAHLRGDLVGVDLIAEQHQRVRPLPGSSRHMWSRKPIQWPFSPRA